MVDRDNPENAYAQDLFTPDSVEEIRQPFVQDAAESIQQIHIPDNAGGWDGTHQRKISWAFESHDDTIEDMKEDPSGLFTK